MRNRAITTAALVLAACGQSADGTGADPSLVVEPSVAELVVENGEPATQGYVVTFVDEDGTVTDVTDQVTLGIDAPELGSFSASVFSASGVAGGTGTVVAQWNDMRAEAEITVDLRFHRLGDGVPEGAPDWFEDAEESASLVPDVVYPDDRVLVPPNLGAFETHWYGAGETDLFRVRLVAEHAEVAVYLLAADAAAGAWTALTVAEWGRVGTTARGANAELTVSGMSLADTSSKGTAEPLRIGISEENVQGGLYYWASTGAQPGGIYRHDMGRPGERAEPFYTTDDTPDGRCVACHFLSRDGSRMAITYDGGNGAASILDVATRSPMLPTKGEQLWNFASFGPAGDRLLTVHKGVMVLRDAETAAPIATIPTGGWATHPEISPSGDAVVYTRPGMTGSDWSFTGGSIHVRTIDMVSGEVGAEMLLVDDEDGNAYYPSWSPDGEWILYSRSADTAYDSATAELYVIRADGSGEPLKLELPNVATGLTNSWARWAPFEEVLGAATETPEPFYWFTFSSKRAFGVRLPEGQPQLWMAPFFPDRAAQGTPASAPAFRLPFQEIDTNNHIAQWTEQVVGIE